MLKKKKKNLKVLFHCRCLGLSSKSINKLQGFPLLDLGLSKFIRVFDPPKEPTVFDSKPADPTTLAGPHHQKLIPAGRVSVFLP